MSIITQGFGPSGRDPDCEKKLQEKDEEIDRLKKRIEELEIQLKKMKKLAHKTD